MIRWKDKQYWYFITEQEMGESMTLYPRTPSGISQDEPTTARICVAPTAAHCMSAIDIGCASRTNEDNLLYVYRTLRKVKARVPYDVYDSHITQEHWLHGPTRFSLVETLQVGSSDLSWKRLKWFETEQRRDLIAIKSWCKRRRPELAVRRAANTPWKSPRSIAA